MRIPVVRGVIERRILVNYRVEPQVLAALLPAPFRPKIVQGYGMVGICLIRLRGLRPAFLAGFLPEWAGISSENAAHRTAVEWDDEGVVREGVYVRRRDTNSRLNTLVGGRIFPGVHHHAQFQVNESGDSYSVELRSDDGDTSMTVRGRRADQLPATSIFPSLNDASAFFQAGSLGYSENASGTRFQGLELQCKSWQVEPLDTEEVRSTFFEDESLFPRGSIEFDCALLMTNIEHEWHGKADLCCSAVPPVPQPVESGAA